GGAGGAGPGAGGAGGKHGSTGTQGGGTGGFVIPDGGKDANDDVVHNPCGTQCGDMEICDDAHLGLDDNCDGNVDEGCHCTPGQAHFCFKGDPSYRGAPGCFDGVEKCTEQGIWGPCVGGVHAVPPDNCYLNDTAGCHAIQTPPFVDVDLKTGTGNFSADAVTESWQVQCPSGVSPCPAPGPTPPSDYKPLQSGEYTVTYTKTLSDGGMDSCTYPLFVGAPGLRIELSWEHPEPPGQLGGVDLDLHVHEPGDTTHWSMGGNYKADCAWANCKFGELAMPSSPHWWPDTNMPPDPVNWYKDPDPMKNTCYYDPRGVGMQWQSFDHGCHNPRLDIDDIDCDTGVTDPNDSEFCVPENINIDFPPKGQWTRIGVYYYSSHGVTYDVHPEIKVYCNGALAADLGSTPDPNDPNSRQPAGFATPVTFHPAQGSATFWEVADVIFPDSQCSNTQCVVQPLYGDSMNTTPYFTPGGMANQSFGPPYPPAP
ncbi:MAG TPA: hypothetical protein VHB21_19810, partial [Minicystis sp.]|nr:hypothetical protein [Minicystis sp.]